jgi:hypothetical protein
MRSAGDRAFGTRHRAQMLQIMRANMRFLLSIAMLAGAWTAVAQGASEAILGYNANGASGLFSGTAGWTFQVTTPITVTELGCLADFFPSNPTATQVEVGLWAPDGSLLASNSITPGSPLVDQSRYEPVIPLAISPGLTYHIGVYFPGDSFSLDTVVPAVFGGSVTPSPKILLLGTASGTSGFTSPTAEPVGVGGAYLGPNLLFQSQPNLAIRLGTTNQLRLSWPTVFPGYSLQYELGLAGSWANVTFPPATTVVVVGTEFVVYDPIGPSPKYYRLVK